MGIVKSRQVQKTAVEDKGRGWRSRRPGHKQIGSGAALVLGLAAWTLGDGYGAARAQTSSDSFSSPLVAAPDAEAIQADAYYDDYRFLDGETLARLRLHYATLGRPHRNSHGDIDNAVLILHWTGSGGSALLTPEYVRALFDPGRPFSAFWRRCSISSSHPSPTHRSGVCWGSRWDAV